MKTCEFCGKVIRNEYHNRKYHAKCSAEAKKKQDREYMATYRLDKYVDRPCHSCGRSLAGTYNQKFCSRAKCQKEKKKAEQASRLKFYYKNREKILKEAKEYALKHKERISISKKL